MKSLLEQLPGIVVDGKSEAERVMERAESNYRLGLQTRELAALPMSPLQNVRCGGYPALRIDRSAVRAGFQT
jgi:hypothetical protein